MQALTSESSSSGNSSFNGSFISSNSNGAEVKVKTGFVINRIFTQLNLLASNRPMLNAKELYLANVTLTSLLSSTVRCCLPSAVIFRMIFTLLLQPTDKLISRGMSEVPTNDGMLDNVFQQFCGCIRICQDRMIYFEGPESDSFRWSLDFVVTSLAQSYEEFYSFNSSASISILSKFLHRCQAYVAKNRVFILEGLKANHGLGLNELNDDLLNGEREFTGSLSVEDSDVLAKQEDLILLRFVRANDATSFGLIDYEPVMRI